MSAKSNYPKFENDDLVVKVNAADFSNEGSLTTKLTGSMQKRLVLVFFYANWCHNCTETEPEYQKAARSLQPSNVILAAYDCVQKDNAAKIQAFTEFNLRGFPSMVLFYDGVYQSKIEGRSDQKRIEDFMLAALTKYSNKRSVFSSTGL